SRRRRHRGYRRGARPTPRVVRHLARPSHSLPPARFHVAPDPDARRAKGRATPFAARRRRRSRPRGPHRPGRRRAAVLVLLLVRAPADLPLDGARRAARLRRAPRRASSRALSPAAAGSAPPGRRALLRGRPLRRARCRRAPHVPHAAEGDRSGPGGGTRVRRRAVARERPLQAAPGCGRRFPRAPRPGELALGDRGTDRSARRGPAPLSWAVAPVGRAFRRCTGRRSGACRGQGWCERGVRDPAAALRRARPARRSGELALRRGDRRVRPPAPSSDPAPLRVTRRKSAFTSKRLSPRVALTGSRKIRRWGRGGPTECRLFALFSSWLFSALSPSRSQPRSRPLPTRAARTLVVAVSASS